MDPKNLLVIMSDAHSRRVLGSYGNDIVHTPNLDALASGGTRFTSAYCNSPICVPSRASFVTGSYPHALEAWDNSAPYTGIEAPSWGHQLTSNGTSVTTVGKLHFRDETDNTGFPDQRIPMHVFGGKGNVLGLLRGRRPVRDSRSMVTEAGSGSSDYIEYDEDIADLSCQWLMDESVHQARPWVLYVSFAAPHFPLVVPDRFLDLYDPDDLPMPIAHGVEQWPRHPVLEFQRKIQAFDEPFTDAQIRRAVHAYYGLVSFLDHNIGRVLHALDRSGQWDSTRIMYTSDHGEMLGDHGLWKKSCMYESSVGVPLILSDGDTAGDVCETNVSLVDCYPTVLEALGLTAEHADAAHLPGESLWSIAAAPYRPRTVFSEHHAGWSADAIYMVRHADDKLVYYVGHEPQLFDLSQDRDELHDRYDAPGSSVLLEELERRLRDIIDPEEEDGRAKRDQAARIQEAGGLAALVDRGDLFSYTPPPTGANT